MIYRLFQKVDRPNRFKLIDSDATFDNDLYDVMSNDGAVKAVVLTHLRNNPEKTEGEFLVEYDAVTSTSDNVFSAHIIVDPPEPTPPTLRVL